MAKHTIKKTDNVHVGVDLYDAGLTEDGEPFIAEQYYVVVESVDGQRMAHNTVFSGCEACIIDDDETGQYNGTPFFADIRVEAKKQATILVNRIKKAGVINTECWTKLQPSYGSEAYAKNWRQYENDNSIY